MRMQSLVAEATRCHRLAAEFDNQPERPILLNIARAFEQLAEATKGQADDETMPADHHWAR